MTHNNFTELEDYRVRGDYQLGLKTIERLLPEVEDIEDRFELQIIKARYLEELGEYIECLSDCEELLSQVDMNIEHEKYRGIIYNLKGYCYFMVINLDEALRIIDEAYELNVKFQNNYETVRSLNHKAKIFYYQDRLDQSFQAAKKAENLGRRINYQEGQARSFRWIGGYYHRIGKYDEALVYFRKSRNLYEKLGYQLGIADIITAIGYTHWRIGELGIAFEYASRSCAISEKVQFMKGVADGFALIGNIHSSRGDIIKLENTIDELLTISRNISYQVMIADCFYHLGTIKSNKGELDLALEYFEKSRTIYEKYGGLSMVSQLLNNIGEIFCEQNELELALDSFQNALKIADEINSLILISWSLHSICANKLGDYTTYMTRFQKLYNENQDNRDVKTLWNFDRAIELKAQKRRNAQTEASNLFESIVQDPPPGLPLIAVQATVYCVELLLEEYKIYRSKEILTEIDDFLDRLSEFGEKGNIQAVAYSDILRAQIHLLNKNYVVSKQLLTETQIKTEELGFKKLAIHASNEYDKVLRLEGQYSTRDEPHFTGEIITNLEETIHTMQNKQFVSVEEVDEDPVLFMLISDNGLSIYHRSFKTHLIKNENLLAMFLTAANSFSRDAFGTNLPIQRIVNGDYTIALEPVGFLNCCYVFRGPSYLAMKKMERIVERIRQEKRFPTDEETIYQVDDSLKEFMDQIINEEIKVSN